MARIFSRALRRLARSIAFACAHFWAGFGEWLRTQFVWHAASFVAHTLVIVVLLLLVGKMELLSPKGDPPLLDASGIDTTIPPDLTHFDFSDSSVDPSVLTAETLTTLEPPDQTRRFYSDAEIFEEEGGGRDVPATAPALGGLGGLRVKGNDGPAGEGGLGIAIGAGENAGNGGSATGFGSRGSGRRELLVTAYGGTKASERAVAAALNWFYRHQNSNGSWSLGLYNRRCTGRTCTGVGSIKSDAAATALALLPFLAAGQTQETKGPYRETIRKGIFWLVKNQARDGDLSAGADQTMYTHGLATIALCEAYGMTGDKRVGAAAQAAVGFIENAQNLGSGGWRYHPGDLGDTSVVGWQVMALKSAQMAGLAVNTQQLELVRKWLKSVARGKQEGLFAYQPLMDPTPTMTSVGILCLQYLGAGRDEPRMVEGREYLLAHPPDNQYLRDTYYWYYATQVMHNFNGPEWDIWNRQMRRVLVESQVREGCSTGSWDPASPTPDKWGENHGGRLMTTSFATLTLEIYYRYLPLYRIHPSNRAPGDQDDADELIESGSKPPQDLSRDQRPELQSARIGDPGRS